MKSRIVFYKLQRLWYQASWTLADTATNIRNVFKYVGSCSICVQNFVEFQLIITDLCLVLYLLNILVPLVTSQFLLNQEFKF